MCASGLDVISFHLDKKINAYMPLTSNILLACIMKCHVIMIFKYDSFVV